jgi:hypothetical protein
VRRLVQHGAQGEPREARAKPKLHGILGRTLVRHRAADTSDVAEDRSRRVVDVAPPTRRINEDCEEAVVVAELAAEQPVGLDEIDRRLGPDLRHETSRGIVNDEHIVDDLRRDCRANGRRGVFLLAPVVPWRRTLAQRLALAPVQVCRSCPRKPIDSRLGTGDAVPSR